MGCGATRVKNYVKNVLVLGANELLGKATVSELHRLNIEVTAGISDLRSNDSYEYNKNRIRVTQIDFTSEEEILIEKMKNFEAVFLAIPLNKKNQNQILNIVKAAKSAGVSYILMNSSFNKAQDTQCAKQISEIEQQIKQINISYGILRIPLLLDHILSDLDSIKNDSTLKGPIEGNIQFIISTSRDVAEIVAEVLTNYDDFQFKTVKIGSDKKNYDQLALEFSDLINKPIKYQQIEISEMKKQITKKGFTNYEVEEILNKFGKIENDESKLSILANNFKKITFKKPTTTNQWIKLNIEYFVEKIEKQSILVLGSSGQIGQATVKNLLQKKADVTAGSRNPEKLKNLENLGAKIVKADMGQNKDELTQILKDFNIVFIVTPGHVDRSQLSINAIQAAKKANVEYILLVSVPSVNHPETIFGGQFIKIENELKNSGIKYGILRLPAFTENFLSHSQQIIQENTFYGPLGYKTKLATVTVEDASNAASEILSDYKNHIKKQYKIVSDLQSQEELAATFSNVLGRSIKYVQTKYEDTKQQLQQHIPEWQADGILELYKLADQQDSSQTSLTNHFNCLTQKQPTLNQQWITNNLSRFKQSS